MPSPIPETDDVAPESALAPSENLARLVAHAINNPLAALLMDLDSTLELLEGASEEPDATKRVEHACRLLREMRKSALRVHSIVEDMKQTSNTADAVQMLSEAPSITATTATAPNPSEGKSVVARVLVVDDDALVAGAVKRTLREHDVVVKSGAQEALALLQSGDRFGVVLCDLMMPDMTGIDLYEAVLRLDPGQAERMVFVTGGAVTVRAREFVASTQNQVLEKPFDVRRLREIIARTLK